MSNSEILTKLRQLHEELTEINEDLRAADEVDGQTVDALGALVSDVTVLVDRARELEQEPDSESLREELMDRVTQFECEHPSVTRFLTEVGDVLARIGF